MKCFYVGMYPLSLNGINLRKALLQVRMRSSALFMIKKAENRKRLLIFFKIFTVFFAQYMV